MFRKRIIAWFSIFVICFSIIPAAYAEEYISKNSTWWEWVMHSAIKATGELGVVGDVVQWTGAKLEGDVCELSEDGYHYSDHLIGVGELTDQYGRQMAKAVCKYCNKTFNCYASDLQQSYEAQVEELPATGVSSSGGLIWQSRISDLYFFYASDGSINWLNLSGVSEDPSDYIISCSRSSSSSSSFSLSNWKFRFGFRGLPISGSYCLLEAPLFSFRGVQTDSTISTYSQVYSKGSFVHYSSGSDSSTFTFPLFEISGNFTFVSFLFSLPVFEIIPDSVIDINSGDTYNITSRPTSITGDYGIIGDNGQIIKVEGDKIINETNNNYYNPATGETTTITDWSYNYEDRSYTVTTESGDTVTITYGDENVVIKEGDTTYNVYYLVNGSGSEDPGPGPDVPDVCDHTWTETGRTEPTCTTVGKVTSTCSKCSQTKTETIPATGHTWVVDRTVQTTYDEEGNLLQQGYTIYKCSVCGEQYKDMEGTGPPGPEEEKSIWEKIGDFFGTIGGGFIDIIDAIAGKLLDALIALAEMMMEKFKTIVETILSIFDEVPALFGGFLDFLAAVFPFLPPEITTILTFGVIAITFIGILKAVRR